ERIEPKLEDDEKDKFTVEWLSIPDAERKITDELHKYLFEKFVKGSIHAGEGILVNSGQFNGMTVEKAKSAITQWLTTEGIGAAQVQYRLRDWLISRQRYWGAPIPIIHCEKCGAVAVPESDLPVVLPLNQKFDKSGRSPLQTHPNFVNV